MYIYEAKFEGEIRWTQLFLYPPTQRNLLNALKDADLTEAAKELLKSKIESMGDFKLPSIKDWEDTCPSGISVIKRHSLRENRAR